MTYVYRARWIDQAGAWEWHGWILWDPGGCVGCWQVNVRNQGSWKLVRPFARDKWCYPIAYLEGRAGGSYYWSQSGNCD